MAVRIRMQRLGRKHRPYYRINAVDSRTRDQGKVIENLGYYDPMHPDQDKQIVLKEEPIKAWLAKGAQPSDTVRDMLARADILDDKAKAAWEADREVARQRVEARQAVKAIEAIVAELDKLAGDAEGDITAQVNEAKKQLNIAKVTVTKADNAKASAAQAAAEKARDDAKAAAAKPAEEAPAEEPSEEAPAEES